LKSVAVAAASFTPLGRWRAGGLGTLGAPAVTVIDCKSYFLICLCLALFRCHRLWCETLIGDWYASA
jgi:hypothetical protein